MAVQHSPIGIVDSGIGGFSVVRKLQRTLPHEDLIYFGDGGNMPYGNHSAREILTMTRYMLRFMEERGVKALLVACNTISCLADQFREDLACPVLNIVEAGAEAAAQLPGRRVGVLSTCFTQTSGCYPREIGLRSPDKQVVSRGCPDLARLIEANLGEPSGWGAIEADLKENMDALVDQGIDGCLLGCTHYPLVEEEIRRLYPSLPLMDPADQLARMVARFLEEQGLGNSRQGPGTLDIYTTADPEEYRDKAVRAGLDPVTSVRSFPRLQL